VRATFTTRLNQTAVKYGDHAPAVAVCCNVCRTCVSTNLIGLAWAGTVGAGLAAMRLLRRTP
jgi:hypothetical protein